MNARVSLRNSTSGDQGLAPQALELLNRTQGRGLFGPDYLDQACRFIYHSVRLRNIARSRRWPTLESRTLSLAQTARV